MRLFITPQARKDIFEIQQFYIDYPSRFDFIVKRIDEGIKTIINFPNAGVILSLFPEESSLYRSYVIDKYYKLVYKVINDTIYIVSVWDCRQNPNKLHDKL